MSTTNDLTLLLEDKRTQLLSTSKTAKKEKDGKTRYQKRVKSKVKSNVSNLNKVDFNKLFKDNIVTVNLDVQGETDQYLVTISFGGFLDELRRELKRSNDIISLKIIIRALLNSFNSDNVYIRCNCPDFRYRFAYYLSKEDIIAGDKENRPSDITNPNNDLGDGCKHIMLVLNNTGWIIKLSSVIHNYINYMKEHYKKLYTDIIYPSIYQRRYEEPIDNDDMIDTDELDTSTDIIDKSNIYARDKGKFKVGNKASSKENRLKKKQRIQDEQNLKLSDIRHSESEE